jgi:two-component system response regulator YesN
MCSYSVVIIDDEPWTREVVKHLGRWKELGLTIVGEASDGDLGLEMVRELRPDIILTDVRMPYLNGIDLIRTLRAENNDAQVIFFSGYDDSSYIRSALRLGAADYLLKPIKPNELNERLEKCVEARNRWTAQESESSAAIAKAPGFIDAAWAKPFYLLCGELQLALQSGERSAVEKKLTEIRTLIVQHEGDEPRSSSLIQVYYAMMGTLQRFLSNSGYSVDEVFGKNDTAFVFGRESTCAALFRFTRELLIISIERVCDLTRNSTKLNLEAVREFAKESYTRGITLEETAAHFFVTKEYLSKVFKMKFGEGFTEYVTKLRMERALRLMCEYDIAIKDIGPAVGYFDTAHFYRVFKKHFGFTPGQMRAALNISNTDREE